MLNSSLIGKEQYNANMKRLESEHNQNSWRPWELISGSHEASWMIRSNSERGQSWNYWGEEKKLLEDYGLS